MKFLTFIMFVVGAQSANAGSFSYYCSKISGNLPNAVAATIGGLIRDPIEPFDFRVRVMNARGQQIETGRCNASTQYEACFAKDMYGNGAPHSNQLAVKFLSNVNLANNRREFRVKIRNRRGASEFSCKKI